MGIDAQLDQLLQLKRPETISTSHGVLVYNDAAKKYEPLVPIRQPVGEFDRTVSNVESFIAYVVEEARRRNNPTGDKITIIFNQSGGICFLADGLNSDEISYSRTISPQWRLLTSNLNRKVTHAELLRIFQCLRPSFFDGDGGYADFMRAYRRVTFDASVNVTSQPLIVDGQSGSSISFKFSRSDGGETNGQLPAQLLLKLPYARGSSREYVANVEIDSELRDKKEDKKEIVFTLTWPDVDNVIAEAIQDEVADFRAAIAEKLPAALVVLNF